MMAILKLLITFLPDNRFFQNEKLSPTWSNSSSTVIKTYVADAFTSTRFYWQINYVIGANLSVKFKTVQVFEETMSAKKIG